MAELSPVQYRVLEMVKTYIAAHGYPPTRREISRAFGWKSDNAAQEALQRLKAAGRIEMDFDTNRGIRLCDQTVNTPLCDSTPAQEKRVCPHCHQVIPDA